MTDQSEQSSQDESSETSPIAILSHTISYKLLDSTMSDTTIAQQLNANKHYQALDDNHLRTFFAADLYHGGIAIIGIRKSKSIVAIIRDCREARIKMSRIATAVDNQELYTILKADAEDE